MSDAFLRHIRATLDEIDGAGLFKRERLLAGPQGGHIRVASAGGARDMLNLCANNYLGLADHPEIVAAATAGDGRVRLRHGLGALHLRGADAASRARAGDRKTPRQGRRDRVRRLLRRQRRRVRAAAGRRGRDHLRRPQPRLDHRRRPAVQGEALPLRQFRHERARGPAEAGRGRRRAVQADRDRRRLLDGRPCREAHGDLRARRTLRRARAGRRLPRDRPSRREGPRHAGADRRGSARRHRHRHVRQDARRRHGRLRRRGAADRRPPAPAGAALSLLELARAAGRRRRAEGARDRRSLPTTAARCSRPMRGASAPGSKRPGLRAAARRDADHSGDARRGAARPGARRARSTSAASMSRASSFPWCRRARRASAPRCRRR